MTLRRLCIFAGSNAGTRPSYREAATELGRVLGQRSIDMVYGGAHVGLMGAAADAALAAGREVVGVIPEALVTRELAHTGLTSLHVVGTMHERKALMAELADGFIALPGGWGTLEELFEVLTWGQLQIHDKPCGLLNVDGYFDPLLAFIERTVSEGFVQRAYLDMLTVESTAGVLIDRLGKYRVPRAQKWIPRRNEFIMAVAHKTAALWRRITGDRHMKRTILAALCVSLLAASVFAQAPKGWRERIDRSTSAVDPDGPGNVKFVAMGNGFHATTPQAAVFWNPANTMTGSYTVKGTFALQKPSGHTNYYGLIFGGSGLEGPQQTYLYFLVAQDGTWLVKHRENDATHDIARAANAAVVKPMPAGPEGKSTNALEVRVGADKVDFVVNGTVVHSAPKTGMLAKTDGIYGIRVNHLLDVHIEGFSASK